MDGDSSSLKIIGSSPPMKAVAETIERVADTGVDVLILGETGTGKELVARSVHRLGRAAIKWALRLSRRRNAYSQVGTAPSSINRKMATAILTYGRRTWKGFSMPVLTWATSR